MRVRVRVRVRVSERDGTKRNETKVLMNVTAGVLAKSPLVNSHLLTPLLDTPACHLHGVGMYRNS